MFETKAHATNLQGTTYIYYIQHGLSTSFFIFEGILLFNLTMLLLFLIVDIRDIYNAIP